MAKGGPGELLNDRRILVVEDEYFVADDIARALAISGAVVVGPVPTRQEALRLLASERIDAAVLDINLRGEMVYPVADALRERGVPFVFATGYDRAAIQAGYRDVPRWEKPFKLDELVEALPQLLPAV
jgi:CheY-like chemotaxis protein